MEQSHRRPELRKCTREFDHTEFRLKSNTKHRTYNVDRGRKHAEHEDNYGRYPLMSRDSPYSEALECYMSRNNMNDD